MKNNGEFRRLIIRRNNAGKWEGVDPVTGKVFTQEEVSKTKKKNEIHHIPS